MSLELFTGTWSYDKDQSHLNSPTPLHWVQRVLASPDRIWVQEEIARPTGTSIVEVDAVPDGKFYPVTGSPLADEISYRNDGNTIAGTGRKNGTISFRERLTVTDPNVMTMDLYVLVDGKETSLGLARFKRQGHLPEF